MVHTTHQQPTPAPLTFEVRPASRRDAGELVRLRRLMFEAMDIDAGGDEWQAAGTAWFADATDRGDVVALVVDAPDGSGQLAGTAVAEILQRIPRPVNPTGRMAYLSSVSTDPRWQRQGIGRALAEALLSELRARGVTFFELHATPMGRGLYESLGFRPRDGAPEMRLIDAAASSDC